MPRPPHFRCFLSFAACGFIHFIQNAKIASANSEKFFPKKRQNYHPFSEIIPFVQKPSLLLLATCSSFFPPSPAAIVCLTASWRLNSQSIYHFLFVKVLSYFIKREVLGLFCGGTLRSPAAPLRGGQALLCTPPRDAGAPREHGKAMFGTRVTFPSRGKSPKARQNLRFWTPSVRDRRPFRARYASRRATLSHELSPICHFEQVGKSVLFFSPSYTGGHTFYCQSVARQVRWLRGCLIV